ncbi:superoxide dismutase, partial [Candidatus Uhrbacteria bacterium]|nr:superoxide dismutase [Candidatus Uhrbacteria bacterium]
MYEAKNFDHLLGTEGFSDPLLKNHFTLYQGYVKNTNILSQELKNLEAEGKSGSPAFAELKRRFGWEFNGMRLHELYFGNMKKGGQAADQPSPLTKKISQEFGSWEAWEKDFKVTGALRGIGWVMLYHDSPTDRCFNAWINEHDVGHLAGC